MKREPTVSFLPEEERALDELKEDYRIFLSAREGRAVGLLSRLAGPGAGFSGKAGRALTCGLLALSLLCLAVALTGFSRVPLGPPPSAEFTAAPFVAPDRLGAVPQEEPADGRIPVNSAGKDQLTLLPGIGPVLAERIIEERENNGYYHLPEDLLAVRGIGAATLEKILPLISLEEPETEE